jgi:hypothetical protein
MNPMLRSSPARHAVRVPVLWGLALGAVQTASPLILRWLEPA